MLPADRTEYNSIIASANYCETSANNDIDEGDASWNLALGFMNDGDYLIGIESYALAVQKYQQAEYHFNWALTYYTSANANYLSAGMYLLEAEAILNNY